MAPHDVVAETTITDEHTVSVPAAIRDALDVEPGDELRWLASSTGELHVEVISKRDGGFADLEPVDAGERTDAVEETEDLAYERD